MNDDVDLTEIIRGIYHKPSTNQYFYDPSYELSGLETYPRVVPDVSKLVLLPQFVVDGFVALGERNNSSKLFREINVEMIRNGQIINPTISVDSSESGDRFSSADERIDGDSVGGLVGRLNGSVRKRAQKRARKEGKGENRSGNGESYSKAASD